MFFLLHDHKYIFLWMINENRAGSGQQNSCKKSDSTFLTNDPFYYSQTTENPKLYAELTSIKDAVSFAN